MRRPRRTDINLSALANDCGITHNTAKAWLSVLEAGQIVFLLAPHYLNFNKRLIKMPKLYFYDAGLVCFLLGIENQKQVAAHYYRGALFENWVISEFIKHRTNRGKIPNCYYWRDKTGQEIDCLIELAERLIPVEIKAGKTVGGDFFNDLLYWKKLSGRKEPGYVIYGGSKMQNRGELRALGWSGLTRFMRGLEEGEGK